MSDKAEFVILLMADLKWLSNVWSAGLSADNEERNRCSTFGDTAPSLSISPFNEIPGVSPPVKLLKSQTAVG